MAEVLFQRSIGKEAKKTEQEISREKIAGFEGEGEDQKGKDPEKKEGRADQDTPESDDVGSVGELVTG